MELWTKKELEEQLHILQNKKQTKQVLEQIEVLKHNIKNSKEYTVKELEEQLHILQNKKQTKQVLEQIYFLKRSIEELRNKQHIFKQIKGTIQSVERTFKCSDLVKKYKSSLEYEEEEKDKGGITNGRR
jgi:hypothetical protein